MARGRTTSDRIWRCWSSRPEARIPEALTAAEQDIAARVFLGETTPEIARARGVSRKTVTNQLESIFRKLGVFSRAELVLLLRHVTRGKEP